MFHPYLDPCLKKSIIVLEIYSHKNKDLRPVFVVSMVDTSNSIYQNHFNLINKS